MELTESLKSRIRDLAGGVRPALAELADKLIAANDRVIKLVKARPATTLVVALAAGFVLARITRERE